MRWLMRGGGVALSLMLVAGCGLFGGHTRPASKLPDQITIASKAFDRGDNIPARFTCKGQGVSPPLQWSGVPADAKELALVLDDPDAPGGTFVHWVVFRIDPSRASIHPGAAPPHAREAKNSAGKVGYFPPCPPKGTHHYRFTMYALDEHTDLPEGVGLRKALDTISARATSHGRMVGTFGS
ncbi:MAG: YbhB/YbcL family Raf kinase inhibitor-like protein [Streptosporangiaceae bacterium]